MPKLLMLRVMLIVAQAPLFVALCHAAAHEVQRLKGRRHRPTTCSWAVAIPPRPPGGGPFDAPKFLLLLLVEMEDVAVGHVGWDAAAQKLV